MVNDVVDDGVAPGLDILLLSIDDGGIAGSAHSDRVGVRVAVSVESARVL